MSTFKFRTPTTQKGSGYIDPTSVAFDLKAMETGVGKVFVEERSVFDLQALKEVADKHVITVSKAIKVDPEIIWRAFIIHVLDNGSARNVNNEGFLVGLSIGEFSDDEALMKKLGIIEAKEDEGPLTLKIDFKPLTLAVETTAKSFYATQNTNHSASGTKLVLRTTAFRVPFVMLSESKNDVVLLKSFNKIAKKINLTEKADIILATQATPDYASLSRADAFRFMRIMATFMQRSRTGKNQVDVLGKAVDKKSIYDSLWSRIVQNHTRVTGWSQAVADTIWTTPDLVNADKADLASEIFTETGKITTLAAIFKTA